MRLNGQDVLVQAQALRSKQRTSFLHTFPSSACTAASIGAVVTTAVSSRAASCFAVVAVMTAHSITQHTHTHTHAQTHRYTREDTRDQVARQAGLRQRGATWLGVVQVRVHV